VTSASGSRRPVPAPGVIRPSLEETHLALVGKVRDAEVVR
jgi:hypothetical protein